MKAENASEPSESNSSEDRLVGRLKCRLPSSPSGTIVPAEPAAA